MNIFIDIMPNYDYNSIGGDEMNERLKELRKTLNLTQEEFSLRTGIKRSTLGRYETVSVIPDTIVTLICQVFNVSEEWLVYGKGEMFVKLDRNSQIADWVGKCLTDESLETQRRLLKILSELPPEYWQAFADFGNRLAKEFSKKKED